MSRSNLFAWLNPAIQPGRKGDMRLKSAMCLTRVYARATNVPVKTAFAQLFVEVPDVSLRGDEQVRHVDPTEGSILTETGKVGEATSKEAANNTQHHHAAADCAHRAAGAHKVLALERSDIARLDTFSRAIFDRFIVGNRRMSGVTACSHRPTLGRYASAWINVVLSFA